jgi:hypothetical protein
MMDNIVNLLGAEFMHKELTVMHIYCTYIKMKFEIRIFEIRKFLIRFY